MVIWFGASICDAILEESGRHPMHRGDVKAKQTSNPPARCSGWPSPGISAVVILVAVALAASACAAPGTAPASAAAPSAAPEAPSSPTSGAASSRPARASPAPEFTLPTVGGGTLSASAARGGALVLNFTAPDCPTCAVQIPVLDRVAARFAPAGVVVGIVDVSGLDDDATLANSYREFGWTERVSIGKDTTFEVARAFRVSRMGETVIIRPDGSISWQGVWADEGVLVQAIERALG